MFEVFIDGKPAGSVAMGDDMHPSPLTQRLTIELRNDDGRVFAHGSLEKSREIDPNEPLVPWDPTITAEELRRREREDVFYTYDQVKEQLGWK